ncbi:MAG: MAPEG family protein [Gammaproteobacteria bacterium]|nr:MAPEG family protein [Gammaproteobacteria bacterium]
MIVATRHRATGKEGLQPKGVAGRLQRAQWNFLETYPLFATCVFIVYLTDSAGSLSFWGAILYLGGRVLVGAQLFVPAGDHP